MFGLKRKMRALAHQAALGGAAALMLLTGLGFLTASAYLALVAVTDPVTATLAIGGAYFGLGLILFVSARDGEPKTTHEQQAHFGNRASDDPPASSEPADDIAHAFMAGFKEGAETRAQL